MQDIDFLQYTAKRIFDLLDISENTREDYKSRVYLYLRFVQENGYNFNSFLDFKRELEKRTDLSTATKNKYLATAKIFLKELNRQGIIPADITQNIKTFKQSKKHKREGLNDGEIKLLVDRFKQLPATSESTRLKAILSLLIFQGLRQIEIVRLDIKDLDFTAKMAFVLGKGRDDKESIDLHPETIRNLKEYLKTNKIADGALFTNRSNNGKGKRITTRALRGIIKTILKDLKIDKTTHGFRHYFTSKLIETYKGDLLEVARYTRHKSLEMLQVYNDNIKRKADLPRYYETFGGIKLSSD
ncbi:MAG: tyrosine-type recombinase/integrase [Parcubacteria group bacterium]|jgi:integrase